MTQLEQKIIEDFDKIQVTYSKGTGREFTETLQLDSVQEEVVKQFLLSALAEQKSEIVEMVKEMKMDFLEEDPDNIKDKEAYYTNLVLSKVITNLTKE